MYKADNEVWIDFRNLTDCKGLAVNLDTWLTFVHRITEVNRRLSVSEEMSARLSDDIYVKINRFMNVPYVHIREYYMNEDRDVLPTARGISFNEEEWLNSQNVCDDLKKSVSILCMKTNCCYEDKKQTLVHRSFDADKGLRKYIWIEKMVEIVSESADPNKAIVEYMEQRLVKKENVKKEQELKKKIEEQAQLKCMMGAICTVYLEKEVQDPAEREGVKSDIFNLYFKCGEGMGVDVFNPVGVYLQSLQKYEEVLDQLLQGGSVVPEEIDPYVGYCLSLYKSV